MSTTQKDKSSGKPRQRGRKADQRQKVEIQASPKLDEKIEDQINALMAEVPGNQLDLQPEMPVIDEVASAEVPLVDERATADAPAAEAVARDSRHVSIQTIAHAYQDFSRRSWQESSSFVSQLMGARSFGKAIELQAEFATQAYASFIAESNKICGLYQELASQALQPWNVAPPR